MEDFPAVVNLFPITKTDRGYTFQIIICSFNVVSTLIAYFRFHGWVRGRLAWLEWLGHSKNGEGGGSKTAPPKRQRVGKQPHPKGTRRMSSTTQMERGEEGTASPNKRRRESIFSRNDSIYKYWALLFL